MSHTKKILMIAGPNGAGKTTMAMSLIAQNLIEEFINADEIAKGLAPLHPESMALSASKLMITRFKNLLASGNSFGFETTAAGTNYVKHLKEAKSLGYEVTLIYLWLSSADLAVERVSKRVSQGGHFIPEDTIRRRYLLGIKNLLNHYIPLSHKALIFDNSIANFNKLVAEKKEINLDILEDLIWQQIEGSENE